MRGAQHAELPEYQFASRVNSQGASITNLPAGQGNLTGIDPLASEPGPSLSDTPAGIGSKRLLTAPARAVGSPGDPSGATVT